MRAIQDSLDEQVEEDDYTVAEVRKIFDYIEKDKVSPEERAQMFDEYNEEQLKQDKFEDGIKEGIKKMAKKMLREGMNIDLISKMTELPENVITQLSVGNT
jgi:predicted transposase/invertase (TIGR01784 family)